MNRYLVVKNKLIDSLSELKSNHIVYHLSSDDYVYILNMLDESEFKKIGKLQYQSDNLLEALAHVKLMNEQHKTIEAKGEWRDGTSSN